ncbi:MAG TPA: choice-of-anchor D domain-containing protein [Acidobacteriaceae bacterium]|jgi:hypothetical protein
MRCFAASLAFLVGLSAPVFAQGCPAGSTTSISGVVYAPNGTDPLPNVLVYIPTTTVPAFDPGVSCPVPGPLPGAPVLGAITKVDGSFTITDVPVSSTLPVIITSGRWRRPITVDTSAAACQNTVVDKNLSRMPRNHTEGDIPKIAIVTGSADHVECVLSSAKVGIDNAEFTNPGGGGRIEVYKGSFGAGASIDASTTTADAMMSDSTKLNSYDMLMLPCEGTPGPSARPSAELTNLVGFANAGGRVYASHYSYTWMWQNTPFDGVASWTGNQNPGVPSSDTATVDTSFAEGKILAQWLPLVGASSPATPGQINVDMIKRDFNGINAPTQSWLTDNTNKAVLQFVFDTPIGNNTNQCGRVLFNEYHVETTAGGGTFPGECPTGAMSPQEKLLEYSLFELTNEGGQATLSPLKADFGTEPLGFSTAPQTFTWTNNLTFQTTVDTVTPTGDFQVLADGCTNKTVKGGASCTFQVVFIPTALGSRAGTVSVGSGALTLTANLTGTGIPGLTVSPTSLDFGSVDVGASLTRTVTLTNSAPGGIAMPALAATGDFSPTSNCANPVPGNSTCTIFIAFKPTVYGPRTGTMAPVSAAPAYSQMSVDLKGNGLDFTIAMNPTSGTVIAGYNISTSSTVSPLAGFANSVNLTCTTNAPGSTCSVVNASFAPATAVTTAVNITTTSTYTVVGFGGMGGSGLLFLISLGGGCVFWMRRRHTAALLRAGLGILLVGTIGISLTGCSGKYPDKNANPTLPGSYTYTVTATDGTISHSATYCLTVTIK